MPGNLREGRREKLNIGKPGGMLMGRIQKEAIGLQKPFKPLEIRL